MSCRRRGSRRLVAIHDRGPGEAREWCRRCLEQPLWQHRPQRHEPVARFCRSWSRARPEFAESSSNLHPFQGAYQGLRHVPLQPPPHRLRPRTSLMIKSSNIAPAAASTISETMPEPRWIPSCGNIQLAMKAPAIPTTRSPTRPKPVPWTIWPASQPAAMPTANMTRRLSPDMFIFASSPSNSQAGLPPLVFRIDLSESEYCAKLLRCQSFERRAVHY